MALKTEENKTRMTNEGTLWPLGGYLKPLSTPRRICTVNNGNAEAEEPGSPQVYL